jgi:DNA topoisomerase-1
LRALLVSLARALLFPPAHRSRAQVFRTFNASITLDRLLSHTAERVTAEQIAKEGRETALINFYSVANKEVAELCNHQRAAPKNFDEQVRARSRRTRT